MITHTQRNYNTRLIYKKNLQKAWYFTTFTVTKIRIKLQCIKRNTNGNHKRDGSRHQFDSCMYQRNRSQRVKEIPHLQVVDRFLSICCTCMFFFIHASLSELQMFQISLTLINNYQGDWWGGTLLAHPYILICNQTHFCIISDGQT